MSILDELAFPTAYREWKDRKGYVEAEGGDAGMKVREYAAIHLCVPESGDVELDAMIRKAQQQRFAGMALQGMIASESQGDGMCPQFESDETWGPNIAARAYGLADAMLAEREKKP